MVDEFLDVLTADSTTLYKGKRHPQGQDEGTGGQGGGVPLHRGGHALALLTAQKMADELVAQAEAKKAELLKNAEKEAKARIAELQQDIRKGGRCASPPPRTPPPLMWASSKASSISTRWTTSTDCPSLPWEPEVDQVASAAQDISQAC